MTGRRAFIGALFGAMLVLAACSGSGGSDGAPPPASSGAPVGPTAAALARSGGDGTVFDDSTDAYARSIPTLTDVERRAFAVGNNFFNDNWVTAPASTDGRDGLGPTFNAQSCSSCHFKDGRGQPPSDPEDPELGLLLRISVPGTGPDGRPGPDTVYGNQLQDRAINGVPAEGRIVITTTDVTGRFADGTPYTLARPSYDVVDLAFGPLPAGTTISPRVAPPVFGVGLLEAIPAADIIGRADADDRDGDGISGRTNEALDLRTGQMALGRFGWKANVATVEVQVASAFHGDIGIASNLVPGQECTEAQEACRAAIDGGTPEIDDAKLGRVVFYNRTLAVPARRSVDEPEARQGEAAFVATGCASCHVGEQRTATTTEIPALANQVIRPYTDLLVHDMGPGLDDGRPDGLATGSEWRTPPLWGIGLTMTVNRHTRFLHDGRARTLEEAILWHGGEAEATQRRYLDLSAADRRALVRFLETL